MTRPLAIAFLGPSLLADEARALLPGVDVRGPARQGDVLGALRSRPHVIALIDGVFESQPSVWHQELRIALAEGVHLLGASSMGALRAAELAPFGMTGVGEVFQGYVDGRFVDDADVALLHADSEHAFRPLTVPLVNVVATAEHAIQHGILAMREGATLIRAAGSMHYKDRHWPDVLDATGWDDAKRKAFERHRRALPQDVKADDARACLRLAKSLLAAPPRPRTTLASPSVWARRAWLERQGPTPATDGRRGLRTLLLADWARSAGLAPDPAAVARIEAKSLGLGLDAGLRRRFAEALVLEDQLLSEPERLLAQAPSVDEGAWLEAVREAVSRPSRRPARKGRKQAGP